MKDIALQVLSFAGLFPTLIGLFVLFHLFRPQKAPADSSNRINKIRLFWFALTRENLFTGVFPWLKNDELKNVTVESITEDKEANRVWNIKANDQQFVIVTDSTGRFILKLNSPASGYIENDPILTYQFNRCVHAQNVNMADDVRGSLLVRIPHQVKDYLPTTAYPRIDPQTMTLEWYISADFMQ